MKFTTVFLTFITLGAALVAATPRRLDAREYNEIEVREPSWADDSSMEIVERSDYDKYADLGARYLDPEYELTPREFEELDKRFVQAILGVARTIMQVVNLIKGQIEKDKGKRSKWTYEMVGQFHAKNPKFNWVLCHTKHHTDFKGVQGKDWGHQHQELPVSFGKTVGYEIYYFKEGTFHREGDGGYLNWAYIGNVKKTSNGGKDVTFGPP